MLLDREAASLLVGELDRGCPLGTGLVRPMWHVGGTAADEERFRI